MIEVYDIYAQNHRRKASMLYRHYDDV